MALNFYWNSLANTLKATECLNNHKHKAKKHFLDRLKKRERNMYSYFSMILLLLIYCYCYYYFTFYMYMYIYILYLAPLGKYYIAPIYIYILYCTIIYCTAPLGIYIWFQAKSPPDSKPNPIPNLTPTHHGRLFSRGIFS